MRFAIMASVFFYTWLTHGAAASGVNPGHGDKALNLSVRALTNLAVVATTDLIIYPLFAIRRTKSDCAQILKFKKRKRPNQSHILPEGALKFELMGSRLRKSLFTQGWLNPDGIGYIRAVHPLSHSSRYSNLHISVSELQERLKADKSPKDQRVLDGVFKFYRDIDSLVGWTLRLRKEVLQLMNQEGLIADDGSYNEDQFREFLDIIVALRSKDLGLRTNFLGKPYGLCTLNAFHFYSQIARGHIFYDNMGKDAVASETGHIHHMRGHALQILYLLEHIPEFLAFYKKIGWTFDYHLYWLNLFDNTSDLSGPFFGGHWVDQLGPALHILD